jgi:BioD-like phosphotransacetylase family protein
MLSSPTVNLIHHELKAEMLNDCKHVHNLVDSVVVGAMAVQNAMSYFKRNVLLITPGDREDLILAVASAHCSDGGPQLAGIVLTGNLRPGENILKVIRNLQFPVLLAKDDSYAVASKVHDLTIKTGPHDTAKISLIRDLIAEHVDVKKILKAL